MDCRQCKNFKLCYSRIEIHPRYDIDLHYKLTGCSGYYFQGNNKQEEYSINDIKEGDNISIRFNDKSIYINMKVDSVKDNKIVICSYYRPNEKSITVNIKDIKSIIKL